MERIKVSMVMCLAIVFALSAKAQERKLSMNINYAFAIPTGDFSKSVSENSSRGWNAGIQYGITDKIAVGLGLGYQDFYQKNARQLYKMPDGSDVSAVLTHSVQTLPILAQGKYYFSPQSAVQPYVGLGVGGNIIMYRRFLGEFPTSINTFKFAARPEAGVNIPIGKSRETGFMVGAGYNYMPFNKDEIGSLDNLSISAGIKFPLRNR